MDIEKTKKTASKEPTSARKASRESDPGRRETLKKLGLYGVYTAPALVALLRSGKAAGISFLGGDNSGPGKLS